MYNFGTNIHMSHALPLSLSRMFLVILESKNTIKYAMVTRVCGAPLRSEWTLIEISFSNSHRKVN